jgi:hypothetical protein
MKRDITRFKHVRVGGRFMNGLYTWIKISELEARCTRGQRRQTFPADEFVSV